MESVIIQFYRTRWVSNDVLLSICKATCTVSFHNGWPPAACRQCAKKYQTGCHADWASRVSGIFVSYSSCFSNTRLLALISSQTSGSMVNLIINPTGTRHSLQTPEHRRSFGEKARCWRICCNRKLFNVCRVNVDLSWFGINGRHRSIVTADTIFRRNALCTA